MNDAQKQSTMCREKERRSTGRNLERQLPFREIPRSNFRYTIVWRFKGSTIYTYITSKAMPRAKPKSELDFAGCPCPTIVEFNLRNKREFCKNKDFLSSSPSLPPSLSPFSSSRSLFYWNVQPLDFCDINSTRNNGTNLQPPNNQSDSSSGQCLSGTCSSPGRSRGHHVYVAATFCARCA